MDSTYAHLERMLTFDWRAGPRALLESVRSTPRSTASAGEIGRCHHRDLLCEGCEDPERASRVLEAASAVQAAVDRRQSPTWESLCTVQRRVLGDDERPLVRTGPAHCHDRRYGWWPGLEARLRAKLRADAADQLHPLLRAARLYLDLIHVHPFVDGNARAARLALTWWLALGSIPLPRLDPLIRAPKLASDDPWRFVHLLTLGVARCAAPTGPSLNALSP